jgi:EmrB/QacA subfamily drug resistance transporter
MGAWVMQEKNKKNNFALIMVIYLAGIFMGAIDTGIVTPARTVIQNNLIVSDKTGIWMITIYTLAYATSIPIMGKLADKFGRKYIYLLSILLFGCGSLFCGLSQDFSSFSALLIARVVQAIGGGGILPIATAEFGTTFPKEKRGMALGLVGGVYGIANIFGASVGSAILDLFGKENWQFIFYVNLPITLFIIIAGFITLPNTKVVDVKKVDGVGILLLSVMVLSLLYGLKNIDFFDFVSTIGSDSVYPYLIIFIVLLPIFIFVEKKAEDPVMNLKFFTEVRILITLVLSFITGIVMMGMIFVPQFSENALKISSGSGGYFVIILGLAAGVGAPVSGKLIDKYGAKVILAFGFLVSIIGSLFLIFVTTENPNNLNVVICLILFGFGIGFTMGTPLNYMMLENTRNEEANSALATISLIRSIGTTIAPAIMIGFIAHAGVNVQSNIMGLLPKEVEIPNLPYAQELTEKMNKLKEDPIMKEKLKDVSIPDLTSMTKVEISMDDNNSNYKMPTELVDLMKSSDVTTITENSKTLADAIFTQMTPGVISNIQKGVQEGIDAMNSSVSDMDKSIESMQIAYNMAAAQGQGSQKKQEQLLVAINGLKGAEGEIKDTIAKMTELNNAIPYVFNTAKSNYLAKIDESTENIENEFQKTLNNGFKQLYLTVTISSLVALIILGFYKKNKDEVMVIR